MSQLVNDGNSLYKTAMELFIKAGHVTTSEPEFANHSPEQFVYFDSNTEAYLSSSQRALFREFNNVSRLFSVNGCTFLSINLTTIKEQRSQVAHEIHTMIHPLTGTDGSICLFQCDQEIIITLVGYGLRCIMSDWYPIDDDYSLLLDRLDIANMSVDNGKDYYFDMVYMLAREYFLSERPLSYELLPIDFISAAGIDGVDRDAVNQTVEYHLAAPLQQYGDDYVEYDVQYVAKTVDISAALNLMLLEMDIEDDNPFDEEVEAEDNLDEDDLYDGEAEDQGLDEYEFGDIDPEVFKDPTLLVKLLKKQPSE